MIVVVETNFVLELVIEQAEATACQRILDLARGGNIRLAIPSFSIAEAIQTIEKRRGERRDFLHTNLQPHIRELSRAVPLAQYADLYRQLNTELFKAEAAEANRMSLFLRESMKTMHLIPLTSNELLTGWSLTTGEEQQETKTLRASDALVYASVIAALRRREQIPAERACFVTRDRDFDKETLRTLLQTLDCRLMFSFADAVGLIEAHS